MKQKLTHLPLEPLKARYTSHLHQWEQKAFSRNFDVQQITPQVDGVSIDIMQGRVLDSVNRPRYAMAQIDHLLRNTSGRSYGKLYFSDFYHPGIDALAYSRREFTAYAYCWAQTFDCYDFTRDMVGWMRPWEYMALNIYSKVFVACPELRDLIIAAVPMLDDKIIDVGLPFDSNAVRSVIDPEKAPAEPIHCVYTSRMDMEKNPGMFLSLARHCPEYTFAICTGHNDLYGTDTDAIEYAKQLEAQGKLKIYRGLDKSEYYAILSRSHVQFNSASQDWISFTLLEALTFGCRPLYPNFRSFPAALNYSPEFLYAPHDLHDAIEHLRYLLENPSVDFAYREAVLSKHDSTLSFIADTIDD